MKTEKERLAEIRKRWKDVPMGLRWKDSYDSLLRLLVVNHFVRGVDAVIEWLEVFPPNGAPPKNWLPMAVPRDSVSWFSREMEKKLQANDWKGGWDACTFQYLLKRLADESKELSKAVGGDGDVVGESADVGNIAHMIADLARKLGGKTSAKFKRDGDIERGLKAREKPFKAKKSVMRRHPR